MTKPTVLHVDLDAFFVSMELLRRPELRGQPVIVCGGLGPRGVVNTCSYEARRFGVHSAMPVSRARQLCPNGVYIASDFRYYAPASRHFHGILRDYTPLVEPAGADEAYLDVAGSERLFGDAPAIATEIRRRVHDEIGITASIGVSTNKLVSKVASDAAKPDGLQVVEAGEEAAFLAPRALRELPMIGPKTAESLARLGVKTIGDLAAMSPEALRSRFGSHGIELHQRALGIYHAPVLSERARAKSISREATFETDVASRERLRAVLRSQANHVASSMASQSLSARTITLKLRFPPFETLTRSTTPGQLLMLADDIYRHGVRLFETAWRANGFRPVRLIGLGVANFSEAGMQLRLGQDPRVVRLEQALTGLRERFGSSAVRHGNELHEPDDRM